MGSDAHVAKNQKRDAIDRDLVAGVLMLMKIVSRRTKAVDAGVVAIKAVVKSGESSA